MICYICKKCIDNLQALVAHYKIVHLLKPNSTYTCHEGSCFQSFDCLSSFKRHVTKKHVLTKPSSSHTSPDFVNTLILNNESLPIRDQTQHQQKENNLYGNITNSFNFDDATNLLYESSVKFILSLYNNNNFNNNDVINIQSGIKDYILKPMASILNNIVQKDIKEPSILSTFKKFESIVLDPFYYCGSEYRLVNWLVKNNLLSNISQFTINNEIVAVDHSGSISYDEKVTKGTLLPIKQQFQQFFEHKNNFKTFYDQIMKYNLNFGSITNFVQGKLWKEKVTQYEGKIVFPYFLYIDDFEINNPLGSHASFQSIAAIYYNFPLMNNNAKLSNIFLAALIKSVDLKEFGNDSSLKILINELNTLEREGLSISTDQGNFHVHFLLGLVLGDNLGLNSILEFSKSFSANYFCRFCKSHKTDTHSLYVEDTSCLRTIDNYLEDVEKMNFSETGIYKESVMNSIYSFHVTKNFCVDVMHDIFEGVCHYDMCHIIKYYVNTIKIFSLTTLNNRKKNFNYGPIEVGNISPEITDLNLSKLHLKMSAREMMTFVHFFSLMIGDLVPEGDEVWNFYLMLLKIVDCLLSYEFTNNSIINLKQLITQHNYLYVTLFNDTLKPKHHNLIHYPTVIEHSGPPRHYWCFRFEGKHKELKMYARSTSSRKNITLTLAKKFQFKFAHYLLHLNTEKIIVNLKHNICSLFLQPIWDILSLTIADFKCYSQIEYMGTIYKRGYYLTKHIEDLCLYEILEILILHFSSDKVYIIAKQIKIVSHHSHLEAFEVDGNKYIVNECLIFHINEFSGPPINITKIASGKLMIRPKEYCF